MMSDERFKKLLDEDLKEIKREKLVKDGVRSKINDKQTSIRPKSNKKGESTKKK